MFVAGLLIWLNRLPWNTQMTVGDTPGAIFVTEIGRGVPLPYEYWTPGGQVYFVLEILILDVCLALLPLYVAYRICEWIIRAKRS
jgi:hypothetical protein